MREGNEFPLVFVCFQVVLAYEVNSYRMVVPVTVVLQTRVH